MPLADIDTPAVLHMDLTFPPLRGQIQISTAQFAVSDPLPRGGSCLRGRDSFEPLLPQPPVPLSPLCCCPLAGVDAGGGGWPG